MTPVVRLRCLHGVWILSVRGPLPTGDAYHEWRDFGPQLPPRRVLRRWTAELARRWLKERGRHHALLRSAK